MSTVVQVLSAVCVGSSVASALVYKRYARKFLLASTTQCADPLTIDYPSSFASVSNNSPTSPGATPPPPQSAASALADSENTNNTHMSIVDAGDGAKKLVVIIGWGGAQMKHLRRLQEAYATRGFASVVVLPSMLIFFENGGCLGASAELLLLLRSYLAENENNGSSSGKGNGGSSSSAANSSSSSPSPQIFFHLHSNTGTFFYYTVMRIMRYKIFSAVANAYCGTVYDSTPGHPSLFKIKPPEAFEKELDAFLQKHPLASKPVAIRKSVAEAFKSVFPELKKTKMTEQKKSGDVEGGAAGPTDELSFDNVSLLEAHFASAAAAASPTSLTSPTGPDSVSGTSQKIYPIAATGTSSSAPVIVRDDLNPLVSLATPCVLTNPLPISGSWRSVGFANGDKCNPILWVWYSWMMAFVVTPLVLRRNQYFHWFWWPVCFVVGLKEYAHTSISKTFGPYFKKVSSTTSSSPKKKNLIDASEDVHMTRYGPLLTPHAIPSMEKLARLLSDPSNTEDGCADDYEGALRHLNAVVSLDRLVNRDIEAPTIAPELFLYSDGDKMVRDKDIQKYIYARIATNYYNKSPAVFVHRFRKSPHVAHLLKHPGEYGQCLDNFLAFAVKAKANNAEASSCNTNGTNVLPKLRVPGATSTGPLPRL